MMKYTEIIQEIRHINKAEQEVLPLHAPVFGELEKELVLDAIDSTYVSSVGKYVDQFEAMLQKITGVKRAVACVNGTSALEICLRLAGVVAGDLVITQSLSFVATTNAIVHIGAEPIFLDVDRATLGLSPREMQHFLEEECEIRGKACYHKKTEQRVAACMPMHCFGFPCAVHDINMLCDTWHIPLVEDAAEALGSTYCDKHCGSFGLLGALSFNGNKIVTTGGGGAILTNDEVLGTQAKHLTTTAKLPHKWKFYHDTVGWNFRMPNLNAALGCAQLEHLPAFISDKRARALAYAELFANTNWTFLKEPNRSCSNYWLCSVLTNNRKERDTFLDESNCQGVMTRPVWEPLHTLPMYRKCMRGDMPITMNIADRLVNIPSGYRSV